MTRLYIISAALIVVLIGSSCNEHTTHANKQTPTETRSDQNQVEFTAKFGLVIQEDKPYAKHYTVSFNGMVRRYDLYLARINDDRPESELQQLRHETRLSEARMSTLLGLFEDYGFVGFPQLVPTMRDPRQIINIPSSGQVISLRSKPDTEFVAVQNEPLRGGEYPDGFNEFLAELQSFFADIE